MAGHDVLAITLRAIFYYVAKYPEVSDTLRQEFEGVEEEPDTGTVSYETLSRLPYL